MVIYCLLKTRVRAVSKRQVKNEGKESAVTVGLIATIGLDDKGLGDGAHVFFYIFGMCFIYFSVSF